MFLGVIWLPTIGLKVDDETKKLWDILNKHPDRVGTAELRKALKRIIEEYRWWIERYESITEKKGIEEGLDISEVFVMAEKDILKEFE